MTIVVNGNIIEIEGSLSLRDLTEMKRLDIEKIVIELNGRIVPKDSYDETLLCHNDKLEIVSFVGGG